MAINELPFTVDQLGTGSIFDIDGTEFTYEIIQNPTFKYFIMTVKDDEDNILYTTKLVLEGNAMHAAPKALKIFSQIIPQNRNRDVPAQQTVYDETNFGTEVKLYEHTA